MNRNAISTFKKKVGRKGSQSGIALFMVISAIAVLAVLTTELTYTTQVQSRMAYNAVDNLKSFYLAKAGYKLSLVRLKAYFAIKKFAAGNKNDQIKKVLNQNLINMIWEMPFIFPVPMPPEADIITKDKVNEFMKTSSLQGTFTTNISGESAKMNLNNLFVKQAKVPAGQPSNPSPTPTPTPTPGAGPGQEQVIEVDFRKTLEPSINQLIEEKKEADTEFAETYRNVQGKDVVDAIEAYLFPDKPPSNLPGFKQFDGKLAPLYSITELHLIPGIDDGLYNLLAPHFTVYSTAGINVNKASKTTIHSLIPEMTKEDADALMLKRDDPDVGKPWDTEVAFWKSVEETSAGRSLTQIQDRLRESNVRIIVEEECFRIVVQAMTGLSTKTLEAYVIQDNSSASKTTGQTPGQGAPPPPPAPGQDPDGTQAKNTPSSGKTSGLKLVYWRMI